MTSTLTPDVADETVEEFRARFRAFLTDNHPGKAPRDAADRLAWNRSWLNLLYDAGFAGPSFPRAYGGMELPFNKQVAYQEELAKARVPGPLGTGLGIVAPTIVKYGTEEQKQRWLPPMLRGDKVWAQGYSEPEAGSDLQSLRTVAVRDGDTYRVSGQKVWTTHATYSDVLFTLVRTGTQESRQDGITYLVIEIDQPGVKVVPLRDLTGGTAFAEIFLDDAVAPVADRIGEENQGWPLVRTSLGHERAAGAMTQAAKYRRVVTELIELAKELGAANDPIVQARLAEFEVSVRIMRYTAERVIDAILTRGEPGPAASVSRLAITTFEQELHEFAVDLLGPYGALDKKDTHAVQRGRWVQGFLTTRASTIGAGTAEIQRNTIAEQVLKLPHDPGMPKR